MAKVMIDECELYYLRKYNARAGEFLNELRHSALHRAAMRYDLWEEDSIKEACRNDYDTSIEEIEAMIIDVGADITRRLIKKPNNI